MPLDDRHAARSVALPQPQDPVGEYLLKWIDGHRGLSGKTAERYRQLIVSQIIPHVGTIVLQKLKPAQIADWHDKLAAGGGKEGQPLSNRTVGHAHRVLHKALAHAAAIELGRATWPASSNRRRSRKRNSKA